MDAVAIDPRQQRGAAILREKGSKIRRIVEGRYLVPSQAQNSGAYLVDMEAGSCSCPDFEERRLRCKHLWSVLILTRKVEMPDGTTVTEEVRIPFKRNHSAYNAYQCDEHRRIEILARDLCDGIPTPVRAPGRPGPHRKPPSDLAFGAIMKVYSNKSARRGRETVERAFASNGVAEDAPHYNTVFRFVENPAATPLLVKLIQESALPIQAVEPEIVLATDGTGFSTTNYDRWYSHMHGSDIEKAAEKERQDSRKKEGKTRQRWWKSHVAVGTKTGIVTAINITKSYGKGTNDSPNLPQLVQTTADNGWIIREVVADKGYLSHENLAAIEKVGAVPYIPFRDNCRANGKGKAWDRMWHAYMWHREEWLNHYHARSRVECVFSTVKAKFDPDLRSKMEVAQVNEVLLKFLCHNLSVVVRSIHEVGLEPEFWKGVAA